MLNGAVPPFDLQGGLALAAVRGVFIAALFSAVGTLAVGLLAGDALARTPPEIARRLRGRLRGLAGLGLLVALMAGLLWFTAESAALSEAQTLTDLAATLPTVASDTHFGHLLLTQGAAALAAGLALWRGRGGAACVLSGTAVLLQAGHSHTASMAPGFSWLLLADAVHLLAAALWLGGLVPLLLLVREAPPRAGASAARAFATMGRLCVLGVIGSAAFQAWVLIGTVPGLFGTAYGWVACTKALLLIVLLGFAARNRYRLAPALLRAQPERARGRLVRSIAVQTGFGLATVGAAVVLTSLPPAMHLQPIWPFTVQPSLNAVREDPTLRREVIEAVIGLLGAVALLGAACWLRRSWALPMTVITVAVAWLAVPHLDLLLIEAGPTTYFRSPTRFAASSIMRGIALYPDHCAACHGAAGRGDGPAAAGLDVPPADLTAAHLWMHSDGELFGWLTGGIAAPSGHGLVMPGFAGSEEDRWALIDAIRARNAGLTRAATGGRAPPVQAPSFEALCGDGPRGLGDFRGRIVRLVIGGPSPAPTPDVVTIVAGPAESRSDCVADDPAIPSAYALVAGIAPDRIAGTEFLIDGKGWLRAVAASPGWNDPARLAAELARLRVPLPDGPGPMNMAM